MRLKPLIREGQYADAENLAALAIHVFLHTYATQGISPPISRYVLSEFTPERFSACLASKTDSVFVAEVNGNLLGYALLRVGASCHERVRCTIELSTLYVQEHFVGKGVGSALLAEVEAFAARRANAPPWLTVNAKNGRAIAFYERHGYTQVGVTQFWLGDESHENHVLVGRDA